MRFAGKLEQYRLADILRVIAAQGKSARLRLGRPRAQGLVLLRHGRIIFAASSSHRETLGNLLVAHELIAPGDLAKAVELGRGEPGKRLGAVLVEMGALTEAALERAVRQQIERVIAELLPWDDGHFELEALDLPARPEVEVDPLDLLPADPHSPVVEQLARHLSEEDSRADEDLPGPTTPDPYRERLELLKTAMREIQSPEFTGEVTLRLMEFAQRIVQRGLLFVALDTGYSGMGQFGVELAAAGDPNQRVRKLLVPADAPSILREAAQRGEAHLALVPQSPWDERLLAALGGGPPREAVAIPMLVSGRVLMVFYGDNPSGGELGPVAELELLILQAGMVIEKTLLEKRLQHHAQLRGLAPETP